MMKPLQIVHLDSVYCKPNTNHKYNKGTVDYELIIQSSTIINVLGKQSVTALEDENPELVEIGNATQYTKCISK